MNTVVGFIGPEYLYDGKQIIRAGLEDHFCGKLLGLPMGCDVCYTNHAEADQDDMDALLTLLRRRAAPTSWACRAPTTSCSTTSAPASTTRSTCAQVLGLRPAPGVRGVAGERSGMTRQGQAASPRAGSPLREQSRQLGAA